MTAPQPTPVPQPFIVPADHLHPDAVLDAGAVARADAAVVEVTGPGAVACIQGLITNDVEQPGDGAFLYGALLTSKGMIVTDLWAARSGGAITLVLPREGLAPTLEIFGRSLPPRLARATDRSHELDVLRLLGPRALELALAAGISAPQAGRVSSAVVGGLACTVARPPSPDAPFQLELHVARAHTAMLLGRLADAGAAAAGADDLELARILAGWPRLGAEIDRKTLPQEVRFDTLGGVSYTKGCYTGQETVARLHFRGHPNRQLVGVEWETTPDLSGAAVIENGREVGRVSSAVWLAPITQHIGLAIVRREMALPQVVAAAGGAARLTPLPFELG